MNTDLQSIIASMTLEEKAALYTGAGPWSCTPVERLGVHEMRVAGGPLSIKYIRLAHELSLGEVTCATLRWAAMTGRKRTGVSESVAIHAVSWLGWHGMGQRKGCRSWSFGRPGHCPHADWRD